MAYLINQHHQSRIYLRDYHSFGRLAYSVTTFLAFPKVSRIHAVIEWLDESNCRAFAANIVALVYDRQK